MFFIDVSTGMATLKSGGASAVVPQGTTKLMLPHEMLTANGTAQSLVGAAAAAASPLSSGGHSTTTFLLSSNNFYHSNAATASFHNSSSLFNTNSNTSSNCSSNSNTNNSHDINSHHLRNTSNFFQNNHHLSPSSSSSSSSPPLLLGNTISATTTTTATFDAATTSKTTTKSQNMNKMHATANNSSITTTSAPTTIKKEDDPENVVKTEEDAVIEASVVAEPVEEDPEIDIVINNVVCSFSVRCHLNLRNIALNGYNVEFRRENGMVTMKLRKPYTTASIWSSGKITCTGATSEHNAKVAARRYARMLQKLGFRVRFNNFRVVNVLGTCSMPWAIKITQFSERYRKEASYEPELHPGVTYKLKEPKATLKIFSTGSITVTAASVSFVQQAIEHIYPLVYEFRKKRTPDEEKTVKAHLQDPASTFDPNDLIEVDEDFVEGGEENRNMVQAASPSSSSMQPPKKKLRRRSRRPAGKAINDPDEDIMHVSDVDEEEHEIDDDSDDDL